MSLSSAGLLKSKFRAFAIFLCVIGALPFGINAAALAEEQKQQDDATGEDLFSMDLEEVIDLQVPSVYAASRYEQSSLQAPGSVTIITREEIQLYGWRNIGELLGSVPGVHVSNDRTFQFLKIRGFGRGDDFSNNGVLITINGVRMNEGMLGSGTTSKDFPVDIDMIERVEVIRGPGSAVYGSNAFFAVINVITRDADSLDGGEVAGSLGTYDEYKGRASFGKKFDSGTHVNLSATRFDRHGDNGIYFPEFDDEEGPGGGVSYNQNQDSVGQFQFDVGTEKLRLEGYLTERKADFPEAPFESVFGAENAVKHSREILQASYQDEVAEDLEAQVKASFIHFNEQGRYYFDISEDEEPLMARSYDDLESRTLGLETQLRRKFEGGHSITGGIDVRRHISLDLASEEEVSFEGEDDYEYTKVLDRSAKSSDIGLYSQADVQILENVLLTGGLRYSYYDLVEKEENFDPRVALVYQPTQATALKALYGTAFRSPSAYERLYDDNGYSSVLPESLGPEQIETTEVSLEHYFEKDYSARMSAYYLRFSDLIFTEFVEEADALSFANGESDSTGQGVEAEIRRRWESGIQVRASYAFQENEDGATGQTTINSPRQLAKLNVAYPLLNKDIYSGFEFQYVDERLSRDMNSTDDYLLMNLNLFAAKLPVVEDIEVLFGIYNVFDKTFVEPATSWYSSEFIPQEGRTFRLMTVWKF